MPRVASKQSANPFVVVGVGSCQFLVGSSKQSQRNCTILLFYVFRVWNVRILTPLLNE